MASPLWRTFIVPSGVEVTLHFISHLIRVCQSLCVLGGAGPQPDKEKKLRLGRRTEVGETN